MYKVGILIASDKGSRGEREDASGQVIKEMVKSFGRVEYYQVVPDDIEAIAEQLVYMSDKLQLNLILTSGGTGFAERDVTPEATLKVIERTAPGISAAICYYGLQKTPRAMLSRGIAGIRGRTLIINLPGSPKGAKESLEAIVDALPHGLEVLAGQAFECAREESE